MIKNLLKKDIEFSNKTFLEELLSREMDEGKLQEIHFKGEIDLDFQEEGEDSFLHKCIKKERFKSALWLIKHGASLKTKDKDGKETFTLALESLNFKLIETILSLEEININEVNEYGRSILQDMVVLGENEISQLLIEHGADINSKDNNGRNVIFDALSYGNERFTNFLLEQNHLELNNIDKEKNTIMQHPQVRQNDNLAIKLIEVGADPTIKDGKGETYLCNSALKGMDSFDVVDAALKAGADVNSRTSNNKTILMELISVTSKLDQEEEKRRESLLEMSKKLIVYGIDKNAIDDKNETALFRAVQLKDYELVSFLLSSGVNPNIQNDNQQSVLMLSAYQGNAHIDTFILLLKYGADPFLKNKQEQTLFEILTNLILHTHGKKEIEEPYLLSKVDQAGHYMMVLKVLLENNEKDLNFLDSNGNPLFFDPILFDHFPLFKLYMKHDLDIQKVNILNHNIFFEYVLKVFEDNDEDIEFQNSLSALISAKLNQNCQDESGKTVVSKILETKCNLNLFDLLTQVVLFDYSVQDNLGRSIMHNGVWNNQRKVIRRIHSIDQNVINIPDTYGILPVTYAALLGSQELVLLFIELGANVRSNVDISPNAIRKFKPMLKNLKKLREGLSEENTIRNVKILIDQVQRDFGVDPETTSLDDL